MISQSYLTEYVKKEYTLFCSPPPQNFFNDAVVSTSWATWDAFLGVVPFENVNCHFSSFASGACRLILYQIVDLLSLMVFHMLSSTWEILKQSRFWTLEGCRRRCSDTNWCIILNINPMILHIHSNICLERHNLLPWFTILQDAVELNNCRTSDLRP